MSPREKPQIEVEPLSASRWEKFEDDLFHALDAEHAPPRTNEPPRTTERPKIAPRRRAWIPFAAAAAALVLALGGWEVRARWGGAPAAVASSIASPTRVVSGAAPSHVALGDSEIDIAPESTVVATGDDEHGVLVVLERGSVTCSVAPRQARPAFVVQAGEVRVRVIGTRFKVTRVGDAAKVDVDHGVVEVNARGVNVTLHDGESWPAPEGAGAPPPAPTESVSPATTASTAAAASAVTASAAPRPPTPREQFEAAARLERTDPARAIAAYAQIASSGSGWSANALFAQARLESERGHRGEAQRLARDYLARFPRGPNAADARVLLGEH